MNSEEPQAPSVVPPLVPTCKCLDWYGEGEAKVVEVGGVRIVVRFVGRRGRRGRIAIEATMISGETRQYIDNSPQMSDSTQM
jgi:hypothetical protein